jgi:hypothetical protein
MRKRLKSIEPVTFGTASSGKLPEQRNSTMSFGKAYTGKSKSKNKVIEVEMHPQQLTDVLAVHLQSIGVVANADDVVNIETIPPWDVKLKIHLKEVSIKKNAKMAKGIQKEASG